MEKGGTEWCAERTHSTLLSLMRDDTMVRLDESNGLSAAYPHLLESRWQFKFRDQILRSMLLAQALFRLFLRTRSVPAGAVGGPCIDPTPSRGLFLPQIFFFFFLRLAIRTTTPKIPSWPHSRCCRTLIASMRIRSLYSKISSSDGD